MLFTAQVTFTVEAENKETAESLLNAYIQEAYETDNGMFVQADLDFELKEQDE